MHMTAISSLWNPQLLSLRNVVERPTTHQATTTSLSTSTVSSSSAPPLDDDEDAVRERNGKASPTLAPLKFPTTATILEEEEAKPTTPRTPLRSPFHVTYAAPVTPRTQYHKFHPQRDAVDDEVRQSRAMYHYHMSESLQVRDAAHARAVLGGLFAEAVRLARAKMTEETFDIAPWHRAYRDALADLENGNIAVEDVLDRLSVMLIFNPRQCKEVHRVMSYGMPSPEREGAMMRRNTVVLSSQPRKTPSLSHANLSLLAQSIPSGSETQQQKQQQTKSFPSFLGGSTGWVRSHFMTRKRT